jgi:hypothetical protein
LPDGLTPDVGLCRVADEICTIENQCLLAWNRKLGE